MPLTAPAVSGRTYPNFVGNLAAIVEGPARRNYIRNGDFQIAQRGTSFAGITAAQYTLDGAKTSNSSGTSTVTQEAFTVGQTDVPHNPRNFLRVVRTVAAGIGNSVIEFPIEFPARLSGKTVTFSFWARVSSGTKAFTIDGTSSGVTPGTYPMIGALGFTATTTWTLFSFTDTIESMTAATANALIAPRIVEQASFGTFTLDIADVQLEEGSEATRFERLNFEEQHAWAQRFLPALASTGINHPIASGMNFSTTQSIVLVRFLARARAAVTGVSVSSAGHFSVAKSDSTLQACTNLVFNRGGNEACELVSTVSSGLAAGDGTTMYATNASGTLVFTGAEL